MDLEIYQVKDYLKDLQAYKIAYHVDENIGEIEDIMNWDIGAMSYNSQEVKAGSLFICKGNHFKKDYLLEAIDKGAKLYIAEEDYHVSIPCILVKDVRAAIPILARRFYNFPQKDMKIISITGTKGKSTTVLILKAIFDAYGKRYERGPVGMISSVGNFDGKETIETHLTTPEPLELYQILHQCRENGVKVVLLESSSQALKYHRLDGIDSYLAAITNIGEDHVSPIEHPSLEDYLTSKLKIYDNTELGLVNLDSKFADRIMDHAKDQCQVFSFSMEKEADYQGEILSSTEDGIGLRVRFPNLEAHSFDTNLFGSFNSENILLAIALADQVGVDTFSIREGLQKVETPGRMVLFSSQDQVLKILVDFAHNELSVQAVLEDAQANFPDYYRISLLGSVGNKAINRRAGLGRAAGHFSDYVVLTSDNPNHEKVQDINLEIGAEIDKTGTDWEEDSYRPKAAKLAYDKALEKIHAGQRAMIFLLGKGPEETELIDGKDVEIPSDMYLAEQMIKKYDENRKQDEK